MPNFGYPSYPTPPATEEPDKWAAKLNDMSFNDPFDDDTPLACGIENPEECESCT